MWTSEVTIRLDQLIFHASRKGDLLEDDKVGARTESVLKYYDKLNNEAHAMLTDEKTRKAVDMLALALAESTHMPGTRVVKVIKDVMGIEQLKSPSFLPPQWYVELVAPNGDLEEFQKNRDDEYQLVWQVCADCTMQDCEA